MNIKKSNKDFISSALQKRKAEHRFRSLMPVVPILGTSKVQVNGINLLNFCSNDYLGLSAHPKIIERSNEYTKKYGAGAGASRLVSGTQTIHSQFEEKLADSLGLESVLLFNSGFQANTTILSTLADRNSLILADKKCHNSLLQGALLSKATFQRFNHNDMNHLRSLLEATTKKKYNRIWIVSETIFSMDGDQNDLATLLNLANEYGALFYSDDAHALGVFGKHGFGLNAGKDGIDISIGTFGKAFGSFGAFVGCGSEIKDYLINFCPGFIYTTALPPTIIGALDAALDIIPKMDEERVQLFKNIKYLTSELKTLGFNCGESESQIIPIIIGSEDETLKLSSYLQENGIWASAIRPPTVEQNASRIRLTLTVNHTKNDIDLLLTTLSKWNTK